MMQPLPGHRHNHQIRGLTKRMRADGLHETRKKLNIQDNVAMQWYSCASIVADGRMQEAPMEDVVRGGTGGEDRV